MLLALQSAFGFLAIIAIAWVFFEDRRAVPWRIAVSGAALQIVLAFRALPLIRRAPLLFPGALRLARRDLGRLNLLSLTSS